MTMTFENFAAVWQESYAAKVERGQFKQSSLEHHQWALRCHVLPAFAGKELAGIGRKDISSFLAGLETKRTFMGTGLAPSCIHSVLNVLRMIFALAVKQGLLAENPADLGKEDLPARGKPAQAKAMNATQLRDFLEAAQPSKRYWFLFLACASTGLRFGEAAELRWKDVDLAGNSLRVERQWRAGRTTSPKNGKARNVPFADGLARYFQSFSEGRGPDDLVFTGVNGDRLNPGVCNGKIKRCALRAGIPGKWSFHCLRHTFASIQISKGQHVQWVQQVLGHSSIAFTLKVYGSWLKMEEKAGKSAEIAKLILPAQLA